jgi:hypothetical protein
MSPSHLTVSATVQQPQAVLDTTNNRVSRIKLCFMLHAESDHPTRETKHIVVGALVNSAHNNILMYVLNGRTLQ